MARALDPVTDTAEVTTLQWYSNSGSGDTFKAFIDRTIVHKLTALK
jgi:hypothetical protein